MHFYDSTKLFRKKNKYGNFTRLVNRNCLEALFIIIIFAAKKIMIMVYLEKFRFPSREKEEKFLGSREYYAKTWDTLYPFYVLSERRFVAMDFEPITLLYGGNGSGKSTALNIISNALHVKRTSPYNTTIHMDGYISLCSFETDMRWSGEEFNMSGARQSRYDISEITQMLTSDDIFKMMLEGRIKNDQKVQKSLILTKEVCRVQSMSTQGSKYDMIRRLDLETGENVDEFNRFWEMKKAKSFSSYLTKKLGPIERGYSNGENGMMYLTELIENEGLYLLDEPENSMSCQFQKKLAEIISYSARYWNAQFIIATHSPYLLSIPEAKIYNLDEDPVTISKFWELENMKEYYQLFDAFSEQFKS